MKYRRTTISKIPVEFLIKGDTILQSKRQKYLSRNELSEILKKECVQFVIANLGEQFIWLELEKCFSDWKENIQAQVVEEVDGFSLEDYPNGIAYVASEWRNNDDMRIILLETFH